MTDSTENFLGTQNPVIAGLDDEQHLVLECLNELEGDQGYEEDLFGNELEGMIEGLSDNGIDEIADEEIADEEIANEEIADEEIADEEIIDDDIIDFDEEIDDEENQTVESFANQQETSSKNLNVDSFANQQKVKQVNQIAVPFNNEQNTNQENQIANSWAHQKKVNQKYHENNKPMNQTYRENNKRNAFERQMIVLQTRLQQFIGKYDYINAGKIQKRMEHIKNMLRLSKYVGTYSGKQKQITRQENNNRNLLERQMLVLQKKLQTFVEKQDYINAGEVQKNIDSIQNILSKLPKYVDVDPGKRNQLNQRINELNKMLQSFIRKQDYINAGNIQKQIISAKHALSSMDTRTATNSRASFETPFSKVTMDQGPSAKSGAIANIPYTIMKNQRKHYGRKGHDQLYEWMIKVMLEQNRPMTALDIRFAIGKNRTGPRTLKQLNFLLYDNQKMGYVRKLPLQNAKAKPRWILVRKNEIKLRKPQGKNVPRKNEIKLRKPQRTNGSGVQQCAFEDDDLTAEWEQARQTGQHSKRAKRRNKKKRRRQ